MFPTYLVTYLPNHSKDLTKLKVSLLFLIKRAQKWHLLSTYLPNPWKDFTKLKVSPFSYFLKRAQKWCFLSTYLPNRSKDLTQSHKFGPFSFWKGHKSDVLYLPTYQTRGKILTKLKVCPCFKSAQKWRFGGSVFPTQGSKAWQESTAGPRENSGRARASEREREREKLGDARGALLITGDGGCCCRCLPRIFLLPPSPLHRLTASLKEFLVVVAFVGSLALCSCSCSSEYMSRHEERDLHHNNNNYYYYSSVELYSQSWCAAAAAAAAFFFFFFSSVKLQLLLRMWIREVILGVQDVRTTTRWLRPGASVATQFQSHVLLELWRLAAAITVRREKLKQLLFRRRSWSCCYCYCCWGGLGFWHARD